MKKEKPKQLELGDLSVKEALAKLNDRYGKNTLVMASACRKVRVEHISTGVHALDLALSGGFPENRISEIRGGFSSLKTTIVYRTIGNFQSKHPEGFAFFEDGEHSFDSAYAEANGVNLDRLAIINSDSGEQAVDVIRDVLRMDVPVFTAVDSIASLVPTAELDASMDQAFQAVHARLVARMMRNITARLKRSLYDADAPTTTVLATNQLREKVGVVYGNPETTPGGKAKDFYYSVIVRLNSTAGARIMDTITANGVERNLRVGQRVDFQVLKNKCGSSQFEEGEFNFYIRAYKGHRAGSFDNEEVLIKYGRFYGLITEVSVKGRKTPLLKFQEYRPTDEAGMLKRLIEDSEMAARMYHGVIQCVLKEQALATETSVVEEEVEEVEPTVSIPKVRMGK